MKIKEYWKIMSLTAWRKEYWKIMSLTAWKKLIILVTTSCFTNCLRKYEKDLLQDIMSWKSFLAPQRFIYGRNNQGCSRDRLVRDQDRDRDREIFPRPRPRPRPVSISILASRPRPAKFETETAKMTSSITFAIFWKKVFGAHICSWVGFVII